MWRGPFLHDAVTDGSVETPATTRGRRPGQLVRNAMYLASSTALTSGLGLVFWGVATHRYGVQVVGKASAEISAMALVATLGEFNLAKFYPRFLPVAGARAGRLVRNGYLATTIATAVVAVGFLALGFGRGIVPDGWLSGALFVFAATLWTIFVLQDTVLAGLREARWVPVENVSFALAKILLVWVFASAGFVVAAGRIFLAWVLPAVAAVVVVSGYLFRTAIGQHESRPTQGEVLPGWRFLARFIGGEYTLSVIDSVTRLVIPLVVVRELGAREGGYFYVPWLVGTSFQVVLWNIATSLVVEAGYEPAALRSHLWRAGRFGLGLLLPVGFLLLVAPHQLLGLLGPAYSRHGAGLLRAIGLASLLAGPLVLIQSLFWLDGRVWRLVALQGLTNAVVLVGSVLLLHPLGLLGPGIALVGAECLAVVVASVLLLPRGPVPGWRLLRRGPGGLAALRPPRWSPGGAPGSGRAPGESAPGGQR